MGSIPYYQKGWYLLAPLFWGVLVWAIYFGPGRAIVQSAPNGFQLSLLVRISLAFPLIYIVFGKALQ